jgi:hypothetical protein
MMTGARANNGADNIKATKFSAGKKHEEVKMPKFVKNIECPMTGCGRSYSSDGSLRNHLRLQHPERQMLPLGPLKRCVYV